MKIDLTVKITTEMMKDAQNQLGKSLTGHLGTHFDVMDKEFPLAYTERRGIVFDVSGITGRDIDLDDVDTGQVEAGMFAAFYTGFIEKEGYGTPKYFHDHPQLSDRLIDALLDRGVSILGLDFGGLRNGKEHTPKDQYCADRDVFVVENLCNLKAVLDAGGRFQAHTYPMNLSGVTGLPCRVVAEV
jgi:kynurenine formamidase